MLLTFVYAVETNKRIFNFFSPSGSHTILVFPYQTLWRYSDEDLVTRASKAGWVGKIATLDRYLASSRVVNGATNKMCLCGKLVTLIAGKRRRLLFAGDGRRSVYDKKSQRYAKDNRT